MCVSTILMCVSTIHFRLYELLRSIHKGIKRIEFIFDDKEKLKERVQQSSADNDDLINGVNIAQLPASSPYAYGLLLLDILFTKEELGCSLMYQRPGRSNKKGLDEKRVAQLVSLIQKRYKSNEYDMKVLVAKINQKCRDSNVVRVKREFPTCQSGSEVSGAGKEVTEEIESAKKKTVLMMIKIYIQMLSGDS